MERNVYVCNVDPNQPKPLGMPTMNFGDEQGSQTPHGGSQQGQEGNTTQPDKTPQTGRQTPLGLPTMNFGKEE